ncbi:hypothetical protein AVO42_00820 [Thiomicrospira sp. XS5]|nr:hypothetical protein AVO42_00820 [Thiomicrospira sp. XS5]
MGRECLKGYWNYFYNRLFLLFKTRLSVVMLAILAGKFAKINQTTPLHTEPRAKSAKPPGLAVFRPSTNTWL